MKSKILIWVLMFLSSCGKPIVDKEPVIQREIFSEYEMKRESLNYNFTRYSNKEVTCYTFNGFDLDCKWKF
jgi:hypothetical protein